MRDGRERTAVLYDRHPLWLDALEELLERVGIALVGRTTEGSEAVALVQEHQPDVLVAGADHPAEDESLDCVRQVRDRSPNTKSVVLSAGHELAKIDAAFDAGAAVYCIKTADPDDLASAIRQAFDNSIFLASARQPRTTEPARAANTDAKDLTRRELEILQLVAEGHSNAQLARMLWVTEQTVKFHLSNIYRKLDVSNRTEAGRWAQLNGLLAPPATTVEAA
jgi:DNA-binding NarL/FixJ family response regulator